MLLELHVEETPMTPSDKKFLLNVQSELGTLEWINFNPDFLIRISTVETFHFSPNPLFFSLLGYPLIVFSNENISVLSLVARFSLIGCESFSDD